jgi:predicted dehydrogenase
MSTTSYRVVVLGLHHDHVWSHLQDVRRSSHAELVGVADPHLPLLSQARQRFQCATYADYDELLETVEADIAYIFANNRVSAFLAVMAAKRGLHVMIEKPLGADLEGAEEAHRVTNEQGVRLMVNWPFAWSPPLLKAMAMIDAGDIGHIWQVKYRAAHAGPREMGCSEYFCDWLFNEKLNGGGALIDYACYGCVLARTILGMPTGVQARSGNDIKVDLRVDDNAVVLMNYPRASALAEASWIQQGDLTSYQAIFYGEKGTLIADTIEDGTLTLADSTNPKGKAILDLEIPRHQRHATAHLTWALDNDMPLMPLVSADVGRDAQAILAAAKSAASMPGTPVKQF